MKKRRSPYALSFSASNEILESRMVMTAGALHQHAAQVVAMGTHQSAPITKITVRPGTLGQPITFHVTVKGPASAGTMAVHSLADTSARLPIISS